MIPVESQWRGYRIRRATLLDLRAVYRLEQKIFPRDAYPYLDLVLLFVLPGITNHKLVGPDGTLAGFVSGTRPFFPPSRGWIITIGIAAAHQRQGLGRWLLAWIEQRIKTSTVRLTVREGNQPALHLYRQTGYTHIARKPGYYRDGEAGLVMEKIMPDG